MFIQLASDGFLLWWNEKDYPRLGVELDTDIPKLLCLLFVSLTTYVNTFIDLIQATILNHKMLMFVGAVGYFIGH